MDLACTGWNHPIRSSCAGPRASLRSVFTVIADKAAFTCRVSSRTVSNPASFNPACSHCDNGPASSPIRFTAKPSASKKATTANSSLRAAPLRHLVQRERTPGLQTTRSIRLLLKDKNGPAGYGKCGYFETGRHLSAGKDCFYLPYRDQIEHLDRRQDQGAEEALSLIGGTTDSNTNTKTRRP